MKSYPYLATLLAILAVFPSPTFSEQPPASRDPERKGITLRILSGDGAINSLAMRTAVIPAVEVLDYLGNPVEGAEAVFLAPESGPGGVFANGTNRFTTRSDPRGQAVADFTPNTLPGGFVIRVEVTYQGQKATAAIRQTNDPKVLIAGPAPTPKPWYQNWKWWAVIGAVGAGGALGWYYGTRDSSTGSSANPTITLSPGAISVGGPR